MIVRLNGGLGNQMFELAFGVSMGAARGEEVLFSHPQVGGRPYGLSAYSANVRLVNERPPVYNEPGFQFDPNAINAPRGATFVGYWQTEKYFNAGLVRQALTLRNEPSDKSKAVADAIRADEKSAFLHVRRGDYTQGTTNAFHGMPTMDYYTTAIAGIKAAHEGARFFIFSDEPDWCRANFPKDFTIVDHNAGAPHEDIWLMSQCRHAVTANSSFSWWGCWLGDTQTERVCISPKRWFAGANLNTDDIIPDRWMKL
jgi:hypothetical protein